MEQVNNIVQVVSNPQPGSTTASVLITSAGDKLIFAPWDPIQIVRWGFVCVTLVNDVTNALVLTCDLRPTAGSNSSRVTGATTTIQSQTGYNASNQPAIYSDAAGGSITLTASAAQLAAGKGVYHTMNPQTGSGTPALYPQPDTAFTAPGGVDTQFMVYPGQEVVIQVVATAPAAGAGKFFIEFIQRGFQGTGFNDSAMSQIVPSNISPTPSNAISNMTRKFT